MGSSSPEKECTRERWEGGGEEKHDGRRSQFGDVRFANHVRIWRSPHHAHPHQKKGLTLLVIGEVEVIGAQGFLKSGTGWSRDGNGMAPCAHRFPEEPKNPTGSLTTMKGSPST